MQTLPAFIFGTRPEIIKLSPLFREAADRQLPHILIHTNQHYSAELDAQFFQELSLPAPAYNLHVGAGTQTEQTARMMTALEPILIKENVSHVVVQGDTNSVLAGALTASKLNIPIAHVEAGLRSHDRTMPEETNRIITDHISSYLLPPTPACAATLRAEGIADDTIFTVGNTVVDAVLQTSGFCTEEDLTPLNLQPGKYYLLTMHRPANVDTAQDLQEVFSFLETVYAQTGIPFFLPIHPRTRGNIEKFGLALPDCVRVHEPLGYRAILTLQKYAAAVFTDSGGLQEEACILGVPCITLRDSTERPETVEVGANAVVFRDAEAALKALEDFKSTPAWHNPFGDGTSSKQILDILTRQS